ncbi:MAG TPA: VanZ family protein [Polyangia bacterium]|nr:VanZ family protein [Polyangia bacterium]
MENVKRWLPAVVWAAVIFVASCTPGDNIDSRLSAHDKIIHASIYAILAFLVARALGARRWWLAILIGTLYGVSDEFHQTFTPGRSGNDLGDLTADFIGSAIGAAAWMLLRRWRPDGTKSA